MRSTRRWCAESLSASRSAYKGAIVVLLTISASAAAGRPAQEAGTSSRPLPMWMS
jgi:hypothetical protein